MGRKRKYETNEEYREAKRALDRARSARKVDLGDQKERWTKLRESSGCNSDQDFAEVLLSR